MIICEYSVVSCGTLSESYYADTEQELLEYRESYLNSYHPLGYMTNFSRPVLKDDGKWHSSMWRSTSCD